MKNFWDKLDKPFFAMAPMYDGTDAAFRRIVVKYGKPDVIFTEFVSVDGLCSEGRDNIKHLLSFSKKEKPIVAQLFGKDPVLFEKAARLVADMGFDGVDINMGCPDKTIMRQGAGSVLINDPNLASDIIKATKKGAGDVPVSVKTRLGDTKDILEDWLGVLLKAKPAAITIHARTRKEMSKVPAHWNRIKDAVEIAKGSGVLIIGNGDVKDREDAVLKVRESGCDGVMIGRAAFGNPWVFAKKGKDISLDNKLKVLVEQAKLFEKLLGSKKNFHIMRKHAKAYVSGFGGCKKLRTELMQSESAAEIEQTINDYLRN